MKLLYLLLSLGLLLSLSKTIDAITCPQVETSAASCLPYLSGSASYPAPSCCNGLKTIARAANTPGARKGICFCLKGAYNQFPGIKDTFVRQVAGKCGVNVGFSISVGTNCNTIH
ncbi:non-specific lipid-transfer protein 1 [Amborella trichopoda]|uniref:non-specific lipid-transfer protein 1 n=1 Tax=Amborella trichopoda TaxID=13333 RepID=UPI0005D32A73|nr:non-specific lipid-transfer protein 1 [Amborella trichopoda]|eukprot:XP_011626577.1 non-specific lipid-transfer protein 1 [Amborella trichopoda]